MRTTIVSALAGAFALGLATAALAVTGEFNNMCSWGLAKHKDVKTDCSVNAPSRARPTASAARRPRPTS